MDGGGPDAVAVGGGSTGTGTVGSVGTGGTAGSPDGGGVALDGSPGPGPGRPALDGRGGPAPDGGGGSSDGAGAGSFDGKRRKKEKSPSKKEKKISPSKKKKSPGKKEKKRMNEEAMARAEIAAAMAESIMAEQREEEPSTGAAAGAAAAAADDDDDAVRPACSTGGSDGGGPYDLVAVGSMGTGSMAPAAGGGSEDDEDGGPDGGGGGVVLDGGSGGGGGGNSASERRGSGGYAGGGCNSAGSNVSTPRTANLSDATTTVARQRQRRRQPDASAPVTTDQTNGTAAAGTAAGTAPPTGSATVSAAGSRSIAAPTTTEPPSSSSSSSPLPPPPPPPPPPASPPRSEREQRRRPSPPPRSAQNNRRRESSGGGDGDGDGDGGGGCDRRGLDDFSGIVGTGSSKGGGGGGGGGGSSDRRRRREERSPHRQREESDRRRGGRSTPAAHERQSYAVDDRDDDDDDDGRPTNSLTSDLLRALKLIHDERHLVAYDLYRDVKGRVLEGSEGGRLNGGGGLLGSGGEAGGKKVEEVLPPAEGAHGGGHMHLPHLHLPRFSWGSRRGGSDDGDGGKSPGGADRGQQSGGKRSDSSEEEEHRRDWLRAKGLLERNAEEFDRLEKRANLFLRAKENLTIDDDWTKAQTLFGITTYYRREPDNSLSIKLEGHLAGIPLFEQLAVLRESDLYHIWAPFCTSSHRLAQLGKIDGVAWFMTGLPGFGISRDACFRAVGCDCMREDGSIVLVGEGLGDRMEDGVNVKPYLGKMDPSEPGSPSATRHKAAKAAAAREHATSDERQGSSMRIGGLCDEYPHGSYLSRDSILDTIQLPPVPTRFGSGRMTIRSFQGVIDVLSPSSARTRIVTNIDPNLRFIPQSLIDFCMKKMCGVLLSRLQGTAQGIVRDPVRSAHARRMREDAQFYRLWLLPKFRRYCEDLGWDLPPVAAFNVSEEDLDEEEWLLYSQLRNNEEADIRRVHSAGELEGPSATRAGGPRAHSEVHELSIKSDDATPSNLPHSLQSPSARGKLRKLFPADSMEIALTSPDLLNRWEQRQAKKKALEVAAARRRAALRLKPAQPSKEQEKRLGELRDAKRRFLGDGKPRQVRTATPRSATTSQNERAASADKEGGWSNAVLDIVTGTHPALSPVKALPVMLIAMFVIYHADNGPVYTYVTSPVDGGIDVNRMIFFTKVFSREALSALLLALYAAIYWMVLNMGLQVAFDSVQLPAMALSGRKQSLKSAKVLYTDAVRRYTGYFTVAIAAMALGSAILAALWKKFVLHGIKKVSDAILSVFDSTMERFGLQTFLDNLPIYDMISSAQACLASAQAWLAHVMVYVGPLFSWPLEQFLNSRVGLMWNSALSIITSFSTWLYSGLLSLASVMFNMDDSALAWRKNALDTSTALMSYSAVFMVSVLLMARVLTPKTRRPARTNEAKKRTLADGVEDENDCSERARSSRSISSFSLASGELVPSPSVDDLDSQGSDGDGQGVGNGSGLRSPSLRSDDSTSLNELRKIASREETIYEEVYEGDEEDYGEVGVTNDGTPSLLSEPDLTGSPARKNVLKKTASKLLGLSRRGKSTRAEDIRMTDGHISSSDIATEAVTMSPGLVNERQEQGDGESGLFLPPSFKKSATWAPA